MARKHQAERLLLSGLEPVVIAHRMGVSFGSVAQYLRTRVGEGSIRHSDIYFTIPKPKRQILQEALKSKAQIGYINLKSIGNDITREEIDFFESLRDRRVFRRRYV